MSISTRIISAGTFSKTAFRFAGENVPLKRSLGNRTHGAHHATSGRQRPAGHPRPQSPDRLSERVLLIVMWVFLFHPYVFTVITTLTMSSVLQALRAQHGAVLTTSAETEFPTEARVAGPGGQGFRGDGIQPMARFRGFSADSSGKPFLIRFPPGHDDN